MRSHAWFKKGYQNKKFDGKKVGFLSPKSFLKNKHNVGLPVNGKIVKTGSSDLALDLEKDGYEGASIIKWI